MTRVTNGHLDAEHGTRLRQWRWLGHGLLFWNVVALLLVAVSGLRFAYGRLSDLATHSGQPMAARLIDEVSGAVAAIPMMIVIIWVTHRYPPRRLGGWRTVACYLSVFLLVTVGHTTILAGARPPLYQLFSAGPCDYTLTWLRLVQEAPHDLIDYVTMLALLALVASVQRVREREQRARVLHQLIARAELANLRLQLQPHFLFNALNTIASRMYEDPATADIMLGHLSDLLRHSLRTNGAEGVPLSDELAIAESYLAIMRARFGESLTIRTDVDPDARDAIVPSFLLQPLLENAARHGAIATVGTGYIAVSARRAMGSLRLEVRNDVAPAAPVPPVTAEARPPEPHAAEGGGVGLRATASRLHLALGDAHSFHATRHGGEFTVVVELPFTGTSDVDARSHR